MASTKYGTRRKPPPIVKQPLVYDPGLGAWRISNTCWAAALSSWLKAARDADWGVPTLVQRFQSSSGEQGLDLGSFDRVAKALFVNMTYEEVGSGGFNFEYLYEKLNSSYLYVIKSGANPAHAVVVYGVTREAESGQKQEIGLMDPLRGALVAGPLGGFQKMSRSFVVGWAKYS